jgi:hypothetical protein
LHETKDKAWDFAKLSAKGCHIPAVIRRRSTAGLRVALPSFASWPTGLLGENNMKKIAIVAVAGLALATAACSKPAEEAATDTAADQTSMTDEATASETPAADAAATEAAPAEGEAAAPAADASAAPAGDAKPAQ